MVLSLNLAVDRGRNSAASRARERMRERAARQGRCAFVRFIALRLAKRVHRHRHALPRAESRGQLVRELVRLHEEHQ